MVSFHPFERKVKASEAKKKSESICVPMSSTWSTCYFNQSKDIIMVKRQFLRVNSGHDPTQVSSEALAASPC